MRGFVQLFVMCAIAGCAAPSVPGPDAQPATGGDEVGTFGRSTMEIWLDVTGAKAPVCPPEPVTCTADLGDAGSIGLQFCQGDSEAWTCDFSDFVISLEWSLENSTSTSLAARFTGPEGDETEASGASPLYLRPDPSSIIPDEMYVLEVRGDNPAGAAAAVVRVLVESEYERVPLPARG